LSFQETILLLSLEWVWRALEAPQRRNKENITRATFAAEANFPDTGTRIDDDAILCAVERMPTCGLVMRRCLNHGRTSYARRVGRTGRGYRGWGCMRCPRTWGGRHRKGGHGGRAKLSVGVLKTASVTRCRTQIQGQEKMMLGVRVELTTSGLDDHMITHIQI
jgi:hypothetical protein